MVEWVGERSEVASSRKGGRIDGPESKAEPMSGRLEGRRVLVTHADRYIGPPVVELFRKEGAHVIADESDYTDPGAAREVVGRVGSTS
jgi:hypothetical protein